MNTRFWVVAGLLGFIVATGAASLLLQRTASAQARPGAAGASVPNFEPDPLFFKSLPNRWTTGMVGGISVDPTNDHIYVLHRPATIGEGEKSAAKSPREARCCIPAPPILEFDQNGNLVRAFGGPGQGYEWPVTEHGITVDDKGNIWVAGNGKGDAHAVKFSRDGTFLMQLGKANQSKGSNDTANLGQAASIFVYPKTNEVFVADGYGNRRVVVYDADTGQYKRHWGAYGNRPDDTYKFPARAQSIIGPPPPQFSTPVHAVVVANDDMVYVADRSNNRFQVFGLDGTFVKEVFVNRDTLQNEGTVHNFALSRDPQQRYLYVADGSNKVINILDRATLRLLDGIGGYAGHNAREFYHLHSLASTTDKQGNLYIGEVNQGQRYYRWRFTGMGKPQNPDYSTVSETP